MKITQGKRVNLNDSRMGRDSIEQLIEFTGKLMETLEKDQILAAMDEGERQDWIDHWG